MTTTSSSTVPAAPVMMCRRVGESRRADKFILHCSPEAAAAIDEIARSNSRSMNSEFIIAFTEALEGGEKTELTRNLYIAQLGDVPASLVLLRVAHVELPMMRGKHNTAIRLPEGVRASIAEAAKDAHMSMASWVLRAMLWWINVQRDTHALLSACIAVRQQ